MTQGGVAAGRRFDREILRLALPALTSLDLGVTVVRLLTCGARFRSRRWVVIGPTAHVEH